MEWPGAERHGRVRQARRGVDGSGMARFGRQVEAGYGASWSVEAGRGTARQAWRGVVRQGMVRHGRHGLARIGMVGLDLARQAFF